MKTRRSIFALIFFAVMMTPPPASGDFFGGASKAYDKVSWGLCLTSACSTGSNLTVRWPVVYTRLVPLECNAVAKTGPTGAALVVDVKRSTGSSIFATNKVSIAAGSSTGTQTTFSVTELLKGDYLTIDITGVGSTVAAQGVTVACVFKATF